MPPITDPTSKLLAHRIRKLRTERGWTLNDFAAQIDIESDSAWTPSASQLSAVETCKRSVSLPELNAISLAFDIGPADLMAKGALCDACGQELPQ